MGIGPSAQHTALRGQMEAALAAHDLPGYVEAESDLEDLHIAAGDALMQEGDFPGAIAQFTTVRELNVELLRVLDETAGSDGSDGQQPDVGNVRAAAERLVMLADAHIALATGQANRTGRDPGAAITSFARAQELFELLAQDADDLMAYLMAPYTEVLRVTAAGQEELLRGNNDSSASEFQRAKILLDMLRDDPRLTTPPDDPAQQAQLEAMRTTFERESAMLDSLFHVAGMRDQASKGNTTAALAHSEQLLATQEAIADGMTDNVPRWIRFSFECENSIYRAQHETLRGQDLQSRQRWDDALAAFEGAREHYRRAAEAALKTGLPQAGAMQESLLQQAATTVDTAIRQCTTERGLREQLAARERELAWFRDSLVESLRGANFTFNNTNANTTDVLTEVQQRVEISQRFEQSVRLTLDNLRDAAAKSDLDEESKRAIAERVGQLDAAPGDGPGFLAKAKGVIQDVAAIVEGAGKIAAPLAPLVKAAALLLL